MNTTFENAYIDVGVSIPCPKCGATDIHADGVEVDDGKVLAEGTVRCLKCGHSASASEFASEATWKALCDAIEAAQPPTP